MFQSPLSRGTTPDVGINDECIVLYKFQSPLSRGTTPDETPRGMVVFKTKVSIPSKSGHYSRLVTIQYVVGMIGLGFNPL